MVAGRTRLRETCCQDGPFPPPALSPILPHPRTPPPHPPSPSPCPQLTASRLATVRQVRDTTEGSSSSSHVTRSLCVADEVVGLLPQLLTVVVVAAVVICIVVGGLDWLVARAGRCVLTLCNGGAGRVVEGTAGGSARPPHTQRAVGGKWSRLIKGGGCGLINGCAHNCFFPRTQRRLHLEVNTTPF